MALIVGTILSAVNEGADIAQGSFGAGTAIRIVVNFADPYVVASFGYLSACRASGP